ncbi:MAG: homocysteine biosynthesis protein, partial [Deltaproteobacteria bacterium]|nr:homocysteine biosynthesis protein [Deltaproteobacteria bacterium]
TVGQVRYSELKSGSFSFNGREVQSVPLSSVPRAREIADILKSWIKGGKFFLGEPQHLLPTV